MVTNFVGIERDFTVPAGVRADVGIRVKRADGSPAEVGKATWRLGVWKDGAAAVATRFAEQLERPAGAGAGDLFWRFPALEAGLWRYELTATGSDGEVARVFYGVIGVKEASDIVADGEVMGVKGWRMLEVLLPAVAGGRVEAHWLSGDYVLALCTMAQEAAQKAAEMREGIEDVLEEAVADATGRAEGAAERAEAAAERAEDAEEGAKESNTLAAELAADLRARLLKMIKVIDNYLYIDDVNTGQYLKGKDGLQVYISEDGHWYLSDGTYLGWPATGEDGVTPRITAEGYWAFGEEVTEYRAIGRDGLDGTAVRWVLVDSFEEIPQEGETCNGGWRYLVRKEGWAVVGEPAATGNGEWEAWEVPAYLLPSEFTHLRVPGVLNANSTPAYLMVRTTGGEVLGVSSNAVTWAVGQAVTWEFAEPVVVPNGAVVQMFLRPNNEGSTGAIPNEGIRLNSIMGNEGVCRLRYVATWYEGRMPYFLAWGAGGSVFYDVYAWVEHDGSAGWVRVDRTNELATARVYGLMKYATDMTVANGAPVGRNGDGQACVPRSTVSVPGAGKLSTEVALTEADAGVVGMTASGQYMARKADNSNYGTVMYSRTDNMARIIGVGEVPSGTKVDGSERGGRLGATRADANTYGMTKCSYKLTNAADFGDVVYVLPIGMRDDTAAGAVDAAVRDANSDPWYYGANGHLVVRLKSGGALQWASTGQGERHGVSFSTGGYLWVRTNDSFSQSRENGLILNEATTSLLGGVRKMTTLGSGQDVPTGSAVIAYVGQQLANYYTKSQVYSKAEAERIIDAECAERVPYYAAQTLAQYAKKTDVNSSVSGKADASTVNELASTVNANKAATDARVAAAEAKVAALEGKMGQYVKVGNSGIGELCKLEYDEFAALQNRDDEVLYLVLS